jgi:beta-ring hydroxylase
VTEDFKYLPFGGGKRKCIGDQFALFESVASLAVLMRRFEFSRPADAPDVGMTTGATIHTTNGLYLDVVPRKDIHPPTSNIPSNQPVQSELQVTMAFSDSTENDIRD